MKVFKRLLAIDPSLTCSGWALFDIKTKKLLSVGNVKSKKEGGLSERLLDFQKKIVSKEYKLYFPHPGWSEQKPEDWFKQVIIGIKELISDCNKESVAGISFGGQMHGLVLLDDKDNVIRPAILWNDGRTKEETDYLNNVIGKDKLSEKT